MNTKIIEKNSNHFMIGLLCDLLSSVIIDLTILLCKCHAIQLLITPNAHMIISTNITH